MDNNSINQSNWRETLPTDCPPSESVSVDSTFFRAVDNPIINDNFASHRALNSLKVFSLSECIVRSLSIFDDLDAAIANCRRYPALKNKSIAQIDLTVNDGKVQQTGQNSNHYSWWVSSNFAITKAVIVNV